jgi:hypothetical protein
LGRCAADQARCGQTCCEEKDEGSNQADKKIALNRILFFGAEGIILRNPEACLNQPRLLFELGLHRLLSADLTNPASSCLILDPFKPM